MAYDQGDGLPKPICTGCGRHPIDIPGMAEAAAEYFSVYPARRRNSVDDYTRADGTYNSKNGHFLCDNCYVAARWPANPSWARGGKAP